MSFRHQLENKLPGWVVNAVGAIVLVIFAIVFFKALAYRGTTAFPAPLVYILTTVNGMLAANLGALVGVAVAAKASDNVTSESSWFQIVAAIAYALIVVIAWAVWAAREFSDGLPDIVPVIPEMCRIGLGIMLGVFALALGVQAPKFVRQQG